MITIEELKQEGFEPHQHTGEWVRDGIQLSLNDGVVDYIRMHENYHGVGFKIRSIDTLRVVLSVIE